jgi:hypothetical protein
MEKAGLPMLSSAAVNTLMCVISRVKYCRELEPLPSERLTIASSPTTAAIYIGGKYIAQTGEPLKVSNTPAHVLIKHDKCQDLATSVPLHDGPNEVSVKLICAK